MVLDTHRGKWYFQGWRKRMISSRSALPPSKRKGGDGMRFPECFAGDAAAEDGISVHEAASESPYRSPDMEPVYTRPLPKTAEFMLKAAVVFGNR
jgi:hypothetical protein